ncbi:MAG: DUF268 domain-containing protein [Candidatus Scalindua sp. AMX11]|nr:MAG: DUF268 domain-containing protein [Candidatus Scalindua sp.]NOG82937.1 DUF268 domain-containing protein [Planctomycetota bacterium]RZV68759.1 MAG: DUF268 domain-containing protein [Candidatus Scalindua sp. SCAELEC01]TDE63814.1 MAG: DUF268 domain-containing protein [Candidatus Scalindua sp. AMX11]
MKRFLIKTHWLIANQFGLDPRIFFRSLLGLPRYMRDYYRFRDSYAGELDLSPCLYDWHEEGGTTKNEYFWQDLLVARMIFESKPEKHVDIGSRVDGFVAHVASFREIEVLDVRPMTTQIPGITFKQADLMKPLDNMVGYCDSLSCLHALEHFGLGRYGDPIDPKGFERGLANMAGLLRDDGVFYLSVPIGIDRVEFNANRVFDPRTIIQCAETNALSVRGLSVIQEGGMVRKVSLTEENLRKLAEDRYNLGILIFKKKIQ